MIEGVVLGVIGTLLVLGLGRILAALATRSRGTPEPVAATGAPAAEASTPAPADRDAAVSQPVFGDLAELEVSDVMVHRTAMRSINADLPVATILREIIDSPHTRLPLWRGSLDNIVGVIHARDVLRALQEAGNDRAQVDPMKIARRPWFVLDTTSAQDQLAAFLRRKTHFAVVVDEYGEVEGLVTLEDIIEEIVGNIADEHDIDVQGVKQESDGSVVVDGSVPIRDLNRALGWSLPDDEAVTVAGLVIHEAQSIPDTRQAFTFHGKRFTVMKRDRNRITRIRIRPAG